MPRREGYTPKLPEKSAQVASIIEQVPSFVSQPEDSRELESEIAGKQHQTEGVEQKEVIEFSSDITPLRKERLQMALRVLESGVQIFAGMKPLDQIDAIAATVDVLITQEHKGREYLKGVCDNLVACDDQRSAPPNDVDHMHTQARIGAQKSWLAEMEVVVKIQDRYKDIKDEFARQIEEIAKRLLKELESVSPPPELREFPDNVQTELAKNIFTVELNEGCSVQCTFCAFSAGKTVGKSVPFSDVIWLNRRQSFDQFYYYATDPLDYHDFSSGEERTYVDVMKAMALKPPYTSTAYPKGSRDVLRQISHSINRISVSKMNKKRLQEDGFIEVKDEEIIIVDPDLARTLLMRGSPGDSIYNFLSKVGLSLYDSGRNRVRPHADGHTQGDLVADSIACKNGIVFSPGKLKFC